MSEALSQLDVVELQLALLRRSQVPKHRAFWVRIYKESQLWIWVDTLYLGSYLPGILTMDLGR